jgi:hypothetical protein
VTNVDLTPEQLFAAEKAIRYLQSIDGDELDERLRSLVHHCMIADEVIENLQQHAIHADAVVMELLNQIEEVGVCIAEAKADADIDEDFFKEEYGFDIADYFKDH